MIKLTKHEDIVNYVKRIIKSGDKEKIRKVMERYKSYIIERNERNINLVKKIFFD